MHILKFMFLYFFKWLQQKFLKFLQEMNIIIIVCDKQEKIFMVDKVVTMQRNLYNKLFIVGIVQY